MHSIQILWPRNLHYVLEKNESSVKMGINAFPISHTAWYSTKGLARKIFADAISYRKIQFLHIFISTKNTCIIGIYIQICI